MAHRGRKGEVRRRCQPRGCDTRRLRQCTPGQRHERGRGGHSRCDQSAVASRDASPRRTASRHPGSLVVHQASPIRQCRREAARQRVLPSHRPGLVRVGGGTRLAEAASQAVSAGTRSCSAAADTQATLRGCRPDGLRNSPIFHCPLRAPWVCSLLFERGPAGCDDCLTSVACPSSNTGQCPSTVDSPAYFPPTVRNPRLGQFSCAYTQLASAFQLGRSLGRITPDCLSAPVRLTSSRRSLPGMPFFWVAVT